MKQRSVRAGIRAGWGVLGGVLLLAGLRAQKAPAETEGPFADFVEPGFPFIGSTVDARELGPGFSARNVTPRGVVLMLGDSTYATFDPDLLRMSVGWQGDFMSLTTMAQISYNDALNKNNQIPKVLGRPVLTNGIYPGWMRGTPEFRDPRPVGPNEEEVGRGPIPSEMGRWNGVYVVGDRAVLSYTVGATEIFEQPGSVRSGSQVGIVRTFRTGAAPEPLTLVVGEVPGAGSAPVRGNVLLMPQAGDSAVAVGVVGAPRGARLQVVQDRYVTLQLPAGTRPNLFRVVVWRGPASERGAFSRMLRGRSRMVEFARGGPAHWEGKVGTRGVLSPDTSAYVVDRLTLPMPNPWRRNVRVSDVDFFSDGRAAVVTFDGDVWTVEGIDGDLDDLRWKRFASGLYEPLSLAVVDDRVYVYSRDGVVRLHDLNADGEADFYENFSNLVVTTVESREFPLGMDPKPGGGFYLAKGGALDNGPKTSPQTHPGFRAGSQHSGSVMELSADGRSLRVFASGLREPFIGVHPQRDIVTASDQQGNFVPSTPIYLVREGGYYGVVPTAHREDPPQEMPPLLWVPHAADQSGASQAWVIGGRMGFPGDALIHVSYGRPGVFQVLVDSTASGVQGAMVSLLDEFPAPLLNAQMNPRDGQLYLAGFQIWGSKAQEITTLARLRYTGRTSYLPEAVAMGEQGVLVRFRAPLDPATATDVGRYQLQRWTYQRTSRYGSGNFRLDGTPGRDDLAIASAHLSSDRRSLLLVVPDMRQVMQMQLSYDLKGADGSAVSDTLYMTVNEVSRLDLAAAGLGEVDWRKSMAAAAAAAPARSASAAAGAPATPEQGAQIFQRIGCVACHSVDGSTAGKLGPTLRGLYDATRTFEDGTSRKADDEYLRQSIRNPGAHIVKGFPEGMPSYEGVLSNAEIESLVLYIRSLGTLNF